MSESVPFLFLFIGLIKHKNFLMNFIVDIPPYIIRISSVLEDRTRKQQTRCPSEDIPQYITRMSIGLEYNNKQQTRTPSEDIFVLSCIKDKIPGSNPDRCKSYLFSTSSRPAAGATYPPIQ
jgi:hypothetical protein